MITIPKGADNVFLQNSEAKYVIIGIPDIGIRANFGDQSSFSMGTAIKNIANIQHNRFVKGAKLLF
jgi:formiminoglutamase